MSTIRIDAAFGIPSQYALQASSAPEWFSIGGRIELGATGFWIRLVTDAKDQYGPYQSYDPYGRRLMYGQDLQLIKAYAERLAAEYDQFKVKATLGPFVRQVLGRKPGDPETAAK